MNATLMPILDRMREMQRAAEQFGVPISMMAADYNAVADELERLQRTITSAMNALGKGDTEGGARILRECFWNVPPTG